MLDECLLGKARLRRALPLFAILFSTYPRAEAHHCTLQVECMFLDLRADFLQQPRLLLIWRARDINPRRSFHGLFTRIWTQCFRRSGRLVPRTSSDMGRREVHGSTRIESAIARRAFACLPSQRRVLFQYPVDCGGSAQQHLEVWQQ